MHGHRVFELGASSSQVSRHKVEKLAFSMPVLSLEQCIAAISQMVSPNNRFYHNRCISPAVKFAADSTSRIPRSTLVETEVETTYVGLLFISNRAYLLLQFVKTNGCFLGLVFYNFLLMNARRFEWLQPPTDDVLTKLTKQISYTLSMKCDGIILYKHSCPGIACSTREID